MLEELRARLTSKEREAREQAFEQAHRFIDNAARVGGVGPTTRSYPQPPRKDQRRVDIEVIKGIAFTPD